MKRGTAAFAAMAILFLAGAARAEESWIRLEEGKAFFKQRNFEDALVAFKDAVEIRRERYGKALESLDGVLRSPEAARSADSLRLLMDRLAEKELRRGDLAAVREAAGGSLKEELRLLEGFRIGEVHQNLIDVLSDLLLILPAERIGDSLKGLRALVERCATYPEAEHWIGKVFLTEGERGLAERQFKRAIDQAGALIVQGDVHAMRYDLARLYMLPDAASGRRDYVSMERTLKEILASDPLYADPGKERLREAMRKAVAERGIDKFLELYRHDADFARSAYATLGEYYCKSGRYSQATRHLMLAVDVCATRIVRAMIERDPDYVFTGLSSLIAETRRDGTLSAYSETEEFERSLYYLGSALLGEGRPARAREIWRAMAGDGEWAELASSSLADMKPAPVTDAPDL